MKCDWSDNFGVLLEKLESDSNLLTSFCGQILDANYDVTS